jgi:hypothetical protein
VRDAGNHHRAIGRHFLEIGGHAVECSGEFDNFLRAVLGHRLWLLPLTEFAHGPGQSVEGPHDAVHFQQAREQG